jgi:DNA repair protein RadD
VETVQLRPYQQAAVEAVYDYLRQHDDNPCVVIPTAGGKTPVMATICKDAVSLWNGRVLILAHVRELLQQSADKLQKICPEVKFGIHSAGLNRRDTEEPVILAGIQSVYQKAELLGHFDLLIVDESHLIPLDGDGMYRSFIQAARQINPALRVIGLTATPFRMQAGPICVPPPEGVLNAVCYEIGVRELIRDGYLSPLKSKAGIHKPDTSGLHVRQGEFVAEEVEKLMDQDGLVYSACKEILDYSQDRKSCLIFASGINHGQHISKVLEQLSDQECGFIDGESTPLFRAETIERFRSGDLKYLCNVNVLTTGFDAPNIDCIAVLRPTLSPGLWYQMVGRGLRIFLGKQNCLVLDFGGNTMRHGPIDQIRVPDPKRPSAGYAPVKECPQCHSLIASSYAQCPDCGSEFPKPAPTATEPREPKHEAVASEEDILSAETSETVYLVRDVFYSVHTKKNADPQKPKTMRVDYRIGFHRYKSEWVCIEHIGYPGRKAKDWWRARSNDPVPETAQQAVDIANAGGVAVAKAITVRQVAGQKYDEIVDYELGEKPEQLDFSGDFAEFAGEEIPF